MRSWRTTHDKIVLVGRWRTEEAEEDIDDAGCLGDETWCGCKQCGCNVNWKCGDASERVADWDGMHFSCAGASRVFCAQVLVRPEEDRCPVSSSVSSSVSVRCTVSLYARTIHVQCVHMYLPPLLADTRRRVVAQRTHGAYNSCVFSKREHPRPVPTPLLGLISYLLSYLLACN